MTGTIPKIMAEGRRLFPVRDYGYRSWLRHPGATIKHIEGRDIRDLYLTSEVPRTLRDGRYYPGFDCIESSFWLWNRIKQEGFAPKYVLLDTPLYPEDLAVEVNGGLYSLTPGVDTGSHNVRILSYISPDNIQDYWQKHNYINHALRIDPMPIGFDQRDGFAFDHSVTIKYPEEGVFNLIFLTGLVKDGELFATLLTSCISPLNALHLTKQLFIEGRPGKRFAAAREIRIDPRAIGLPSAREQKMMAEANGQIINECLPLIMGLLDSEWTEMFQDARLPISEQYAPFFQEIKDPPNVNDPLTLQKLQRGLSLSSVFRKLTGVFKRPHIEANPDFLRAQFPNLLPSVVKGRLDRIKSAGATITRTDHKGQDSGDDS